MSDPIVEARELAAADLLRFEQTLQLALEPQREYLTETEYQLYSRGKKLRPLMLLLCARLNGNGAIELPQKVVNASVALEMLHVATLIHDDIVDVAPVRRGLKTVYAERGTETAVLVGDLQFIQAVRCFAAGIDTQQDMRLVQMVLDAGFKICCGELDELMTNPGWNTGVLVSRYFRTVDRKTGSLFGLACESGGMLMGAGKETLMYLSRFGRRFGRAFQIMDDVFDMVKPETAAGKSPGVDMELGRLSLPIIYALDELPRDHAIHRVVRREPHSAEELHRAIEAVVLSNGLLRAYSKAREMIADALEALHMLKPCPYRDVLTRISEYIVDRGFAQPDS